MRKKDLETLNEFVNYFNDFYGTNGIYSVGKDFSLNEIIFGLAVVFANRPDYVFEGDTVDRELVRDVLISEVELEKAYSLYWYGWYDCRFSKRCG